MARKKGVHYVNNAQFLEELKNGMRSVEKQRNKESQLHR